MDDIICVTNGSIDEHERELREVLNNLQTAGYRASEKITEIFKQDLTWLGCHINQIGVKPIKDKTEAITKLAAPKNAKELIFLGLDTTFIEIHQQPLQEDRQDEKIFEERDPLGKDTRNKRRLQESEERHNGGTVSTSLRLEERQLCDN